MPLPSHDVLPANIVIDGRWIHYNADAEAIKLYLCLECHFYLGRHKTPPLSLVNHMVIGSVPEELQNLNMVEEAMIACCHAKTWIIQLTDDKSRHNSP